MSYYKNLHFFDKNGGPLNFLYDEDNDTWTGKVYMPTVSVGLYEQQQIFILEKVSVTSGWILGAGFWDDYEVWNDTKLWLDAATVSPTLSLDYNFPVLGQQTDPVQEAWKTSWTDDSEDQIFTYVIEEEADVPYIAKYEEIVFDNAAVEYNTSSPSDRKFLDFLNSSFMQINVALTSSEEDIYERTLIIQDMSFDVPKTVATIEFYGETVAEDERLALMLENFGRKFERNDALIVKDYDVKEPLADWKKVNEKRKEMLLEGENIFPYVGSYKGLINIVKFFGYQSLRIKEYWLNIDSKSENYKKFQHQELYGLFTDEYTPGLRNPLVPSTTYKKTSMFGLFYDINVATGSVDEFGIPIVENDSTFTNEEVLIKLFALKERLKQQFLPLNARIVDIVGEGIYFERYASRSWLDELRTISTEIGTRIDFEPNVSIGYVRDLRRFQIKRFPTGLDVPINRFTNTTNPYSYGQKYPAVHLPGLLQSIEDFYDELGTFTFPYTKEHFGDDPGIISGCPVILKGEAFSFTWDDMTMTWDDLSYDGVSPELSPELSKGPYSWDTIDFSNFYEVEWNISKPAPLGYDFTFRGSIYDYYTLPHFLPYEGKYTVTMKLYDMFNNQSIQIKEDVIEVYSRELELAAFCRFRNTDDYTWDGVGETWDDLGGSSWHFPIEGMVLEDSPIDERTLAWARYQNQEDMLVWNENEQAYEELIVSTADNVERVGTRNLSWDNMDVEWDELYHSTWDMYDYHGEFLGGFKIFDPSYNDGIMIDDYPVFYFTEPSPPDPSLSLQEAADALNASTNPGIAKFTYQVRFQPNASPALSFIHACAKFPGADGWHYITYIQGSLGTITGDPYSFRKPTWLQGGLIDVDAQIAQINNSQTPPISIDQDLMFLDIPLADRIADITSPTLSPDIPGYDYWVDRQYVKTEEPSAEFPFGERRGHLPSWAGTGAFTNSDLRVYSQGFDVPLGVPVFLTSELSEIPGKSDHTWVVRNSLTGDKFVETKDKPFLIVNFIEEGLFDVECTVTDSNFNTSHTIKKGFIRVAKRARLHEPETLMPL